MSGLVSWLEARHGAAPPALRDAMVALVRPARPGAEDGAAVEEALAAAALAALPRVARGADRRDGAMPLLAVDALITSACEAGAEAGPAALARVLDRLDPDAFAAAIRPEVER